MDANNEINKSNTNSDASDNFGKQVSIKPGIFSKERKKFTFLSIAFVFILSLLGGFVGMGCSIISGLIISVISTNQNYSKRKKAILSVLAVCFGVLLYFVIMTIIYLN